MSWIEEDVAVNPRSAALCFAFPVHEGRELAGRTTMQSIEVNLVLLLGYFLESSLPNETHKIND